ncbi:hypothetical protein BD779DRAFT_1568364, partial [Infundibulicybe gibba]
MSGLMSGLMSVEIRDCSRRAASSSKPLLAYWVSVAAFIPLTLAWGSGGGFFAYTTSRVGGGAGSGIGYPSFFTGKLGVWTY